MRVADVSNFDHNADVNNQDGWIPAMRDAGIEAITIGSQNMEMARWQAMCARNALPPMPIIATYAEPNVTTAIELAQENGAQWVCLVVEPGGIQDIDRLRVGINAVEAAGLTPVIYGNRGDLTSLLGNNPTEFRDVDLWLASYFNDGTILTSVPWWPKLWGHQFTSSEVIAGKPRDVSEVFAEVDTMTDNDILAIFGSTEATAAERLTNAKYRYDQAIATGHSPFDTAAQAQAALDDHIANHAAGATGQVTEHTHVPSKVARP